MTAEPTTELDPGGWPVRRDTSPLTQFLEVEQDGEGGCRVVLDAMHMSPNGTMHGGALFSMFDTAMGTVAAGRLPEGRLCVTMEVHIRYLKPVFDGEVEVRASVLNGGKRIIQTEAKATNRDSSGEERTVASATGSFVIVDIDTPDRAR